MGLSLKKLLGGGKSGRKSVGKVAPLGMRATGASQPEFPLPPGHFHINDGPHYHDVLADLHRILKPDWYLEVGTRAGESLRVAQGNYVAIDPEFLRFQPPFFPGKRAHFLGLPSDEAFASGFLAREGIRPSFGFLDGMHLSEFLLRDFINYEKAALPGARVALHDCLPGSHAMESRDDSVIATGQPWTGDVWKVAYWLITHRPDLKVNMLDAWRTGLVVVEGLDPENTVLAGTYDRFIAEMRDITLKDFGVEKYFGSFEIQSSSRYLDSLRRTVQS